MHKTSTRTRTCTSVIDIPLHAYNCRNRISKLKSFPQSLMPPIPSHSLKMTTQHLRIPIIVPPKTTTSKSSRMRLHQMGTPYSLRKVTNMVIPVMIQPIPTTRRVAILRCREVAVGERRLTMMITIMKSPTGSQPPWRRN